MNKNTGHNICKECKYRLRRVFIPLNPDKYLDEDGDRMLSNDDNILIMCHCLVLGMDIDEEDTIECSHFSRKSEIKEDFPFLKNFN
jgi:hypothetical protein